MEKKYLLLSGLFLLMMLALLIGGTMVFHSGTFFGMILFLSLASMFTSMYFWIKFASPIYDAAMLK